MNRREHCCSINNHTGKMWHWFNKQVWLGFLTFTDWTHSKNFSSNLRHKILHIYYHAGKNGIHIIWQLVGVDLFLTLPKLTAELNFEPLQAKAGGCPGLSSKVMLCSHEHWSNSLNIILNFSWDHHFSKDTKCVRMYLEDILKVYKGHLEYFNLIGWCGHT